MVDGGMKTRLEQRLALRDRPDQRVVLRQEWRDILFLHWEWDPADLSRGLPPGLSIDTHEGRAYLGIVPFFMCRVRPPFLPSLPWLSNFLELNVRTYVVDENGTPGVWFYSLDCNQPVAVELARSFFRLNYFHARMSAARETSETITYKSQRRKSAGEAVYTYRASGQGAVVEPGTLEFFLVERYLLYAYNVDHQQLQCGRVHHAPYEVSGAEVSSWSFAPGEEDAFLGPGRDPDSVLFSRGVSVEVFPLTR